MVIKICFDNIIFVLLVQNKSVDHLLCTGTLLPHHAYRGTQLKLIIALKKAKIAYNFGLSECNRVRVRQNLTKVCSLLNDNFETTGHHGWMDG